MTYNIGELSRDELDALAVAMDHLLCNADLPRETYEMVEALFYTLDCMSNEAYEEERVRLLERTENLLVVDFTPKAG